jgi:putative hemolysin
MEIFILSILILLNGFFALSEIALVSSKRTRLEQSRRKGSKGAKMALQLLNKSENFLSAIQVGITLISIITGVYGGMNIADDVAPFFEKFAFTAPYAHEIALFLTIVIITYVSIVIGELVPKTIALGNPEKIATHVAPVIFYFSKTFYPVVRLLSLSTNFVIKLVGIKKHTEQFTEAELRQMIKMASVEGVIEKEQNSIHENVFYFSDKNAKHIMTHHTDVEWIDIDKPINEIKKALYEVKHSKVVCSKGELDNFQGTLNLKDFYKSISLNRDFNIRDLIILPLIVTENTDAQKVLNLLRLKKTHICCVVDEYGGFAGIITVHDIIENIVGQIPGEGEVYDPDIFIRDDKSVLVSGDAPIEALANIIEDFTIDFDKIDYSTVAGFILDQLNMVPQLGYVFEYMGYKIEIIDIDGNRIDKILITKN